MDPVLFGMTSPHATAATSTPVAAPTAATHPPETIEGWYALHRIFRIDPARRDLLRGADETAAASVFAVREDEATTGWSAATRLVGSTSDVMFIHFRPMLDEIGEVQRTLAAAPWMQALKPVYAFMSVTESGLYYMTTQLVAEAEARGGEGW